MTPDVSILLLTRNGLPMLSAALDAVAAQETSRLVEDQTIAALAEGSSAWAIPWPCLYEFYAIATHARIYNPPSRPQDALTQIAYWLESPTLVLLHEGDGFWDTLRALVDGSAVLQGGAVHDAGIAALCLRHGVRTLLTADRDFSRFPELATENPLRSL